MPRPQLLKAQLPKAQASVDPIIGRYDHPVRFYALATAIPWVLWLGAAYLSHLPTQSGAVAAWTAVLGIAGLAAPALVAAWLVRNQPLVLADLRRRLFWPSGVGKSYLVCALGLLLASVLAATAISLLFGYSVDQFQFRGGFSFTSGLVPVWVILVLAPVLEELAWHSYGTDALVTRMRVFTASLVFVPIWTLWHAPLSFIRGYYQSEIVASGWLHALNFPLSLIPFVVLMNWLYYRTGRSITVAIVFHLTAGFANEIFRTHPDTKLIQTAVLLVVAIVVVLTNRDLFFASPRVPRRPR